MKNRRNYYRLLHVQPDAPLEIIKSSYRALLLKLKRHPDLGGDHWESALLNEAKEVLIDPRKRLKYDKDSLQIHTRSSRSKSSNPLERICPPHSAAISNVYTGGVFAHVCRFCNNLEQRSVPLVPDTRCSSCHSPLYPIHKIKSSVHSERAFHRIAKDFEITYYVEWPSLQEYRGQTSQLSPTGMRFCTDQYLQPGKIIKINSQFVEAVAKVVYCFNRSLPMDSSISGNIIGVEFLAFISTTAPGTFVSQAI